MQYFGDHLNKFFSDSELIKGSEFDHNKCNFHMKADEDLQDALINKMKSGGGDYFKWRGELISTAGNSIVSDNPCSALSGFYGIDLVVVAGDIQAKFDKTISCYEDAKAANDCAPYGDLLPRFYLSDFSKSIFTAAAKDFLGQVYTACSHALKSKAAFSYEPDDFLKDSFESVSILKTPNWSELDWIKENVDFKRHVAVFLNKLDVEGLNRSFYEDKASHFTYDFCNKRDFNAFSRFKFSTIKLDSYDQKVSKWDSENNLDASKSAICHAFKAQGVFPVAFEIDNLSYNELIDLDLGESKKLHCEIEIIRRKQSFEVKMPKVLVQQLQIFLLKYNREGMERNAA